MFVKGFKRLIVGLILLVAILSGYFGLLTPDEVISANSKATNYLDMHVHVACIDQKKYQCYIHPSMLENIRFPVFIEAMGVDEIELRTAGPGLLVSRLVEQIKKSKRVGGAVILAMDGAIDAGGNLDKLNTQVYVPNDYVYDQAEKHNELYFGASVNPYRKDAITRLEKVFEQGAVFIKWIPAIMHIDPADPRITAFYEKMAELKLPLLTHVGQERSFATAKDELGDPEKLRLPLGLGVTVIAAHIGTTGVYEGEPSFERMLPLFKEYPNLYADISSLTQVNKLDYLVEVLKNKEVTERLIYGSDWPLQMSFLVNPFYHSDHLKFSEVKALFQIKNKWDRDVYLKEALGTPESIFLRSRKLLLEKQAGDISG